MESYILKSLKKEMRRDTDGQSETAYAVESSGMNFVNNAPTTFNNLLIGLALGFSFSLSIFMTFLMYQQQGRNEQIILSLLDKVGGNVAPVNFTGTNYSQAGYNQPGFSQYEQYISSNNLESESSQQLLDNLPSRPVVSDNDLTKQQLGLLNEYKSEQTEQAKIEPVSNNAYLNDSNVVMIETNEVLYSQLKNMNINGHMYSSQSSESFFMANNKLYSIGEYLDENNSILLSNVTEKGIEISFNNKTYSFDLQKYLRRT